MISARATRRQVLSKLTLASIGIPLLAACSAPAPANTPAAAPTAAPAAKPTSPPPAAPTPAATTNASVKPAASAVPAGAASTPGVAASIPGAAVNVGGVRLPTYSPYTGAAPDSPGSADGMVDPGYKGYPKNRP